ncbi:MAG: hypothetical protein JXA99_11650 [Candidatus Lokiarchaeota archaeon]|nr:hypothetical protein [Candidatus Lokiarchaeota archaeon]
MNDIYFLCDYQSRFSSKYNSGIYRAGMDRSILEARLKEYDCNAVVLKVSDNKIQEIDWKDKIVAYSSIEDNDLYYKSFFEDIILFLKINQAFLLPKYEFLKANNDKIFMTLYLENISEDVFNKLKSNVFGCFEDLYYQIDKISFPCVIKRTDSAMSKGVFLAENKKQLLKYSKKVSKINDPSYEIIDFLRKYKHKEYQPESRYRKKFLVQKFIPNLINDWKILIYDDVYFVLKRFTRKNDFRASGSHKFLFTEEVPSQVLDFSKKIFEYFDTPFISLDIGFDGIESYLFEYQGVNFGTYTMENAPFYFMMKNLKWEYCKNNLILEEVYIDSIYKYLLRKNILKT